MAHKIINNLSVVDWTTGDPEGDRKYLFQAYTDFINECLSVEPNEIKTVFNKWGISTNNQIDDFPRIWIKRPQ